MAVADNNNSLHDYDLLLM